MKIDLDSGQLFTDGGEFLKVLHCPISTRGGELIERDERSRLCVECCRPVYDTAKMSDEDVSSLLSGNPDACLAISPTQTNCTVLPRSRRLAGQE